jgi:glutathione S-transferase kappa 1
VSPYSWFGFTNTLRYRPGLKAHGISVDIIPFFLGGARGGAGNPWTPTPKWKEAFSKQDSEMTGQLLGLKVVQPKEFPILSLFVSPDAAAGARS